MDCMDALDGQLRTNPTSTCNDRSCLTALHFCSTSSVSASSHDVGKVQPSAKNRSSRPKDIEQFQGCRRKLPVQDPHRYFIELDYIWELLENEAVALISGKWLLQQSRGEPFRPLPCRQNLLPEAIADVRRLRHEYIVAHAGGEASTAVYMNRYFGRSESRPIVAISHCWLTRDHPDPDGMLLQTLAPVIESHLKDLQSRGFSDGAFFFAWCSIHQIRHGEVTSEQMELFQLALENMDIWYVNQQTEAWLVTSFFEGQGHRYEQRGWPTWERSVALLLGEGAHVLDIGMLTKSDQVQNMSHLRSVCRATRQPLLIPADFEILIRSKHFTQGAVDMDLVMANYKRNFAHAMEVVGELFFLRLNWSTPEMALLAKAIPSCVSLKILWLHNNPIGDSGMEIFVEGLAECKHLQELGLNCCKISGTGATCLADALQQRKGLVALHIADNRIADVGACALAEALCQCSDSMPLRLSFESNDIRDRGALALKRTF